MERTTLRTVTLVGHGLSFLATLAILIIASGGAFSLEHLLFWTWPLSPYLAFAVIGESLHRRCRSRVLPVASCVLSVVMLLFTCAVYLPSMFWDTSSTAALVFIFLPFYLFIFGGALLGVAWAIAWVRGRKGRNPVH